MSRLALKRRDRAASNLATIATQWQHQGWDVTVDLPPRTGMWLPLADGEQRWQGWLRPRDWLAHVAPELAGLASSADVEPDVVTWLAAVDQPLLFPIPALQYQRLSLGALQSADGLPDHAMLKVMSGSGPVWLERINEAGGRLAPLPNALHWPVRVVIGESRVSLSLLTRVEVGDMLLISTRMSAIRCFAKTLGQYQQFEEGIVMEFQEYTELAEIQDNADIAREVGQLPVQLEFILHHYRLTLTELQALYQGQLLPIPAQAEQRVEIRANGTPIGYGELVQLEGQLGVEVNTWLDENKNGE